MQHVAQEVGEYANRSQHPDQRPLTADLDQVHLHARVPRHGQTGVHASRHSIRDVVLRQELVDRHPLVPCTDTGPAQSQPPLAQAMT
jgi:hypothetical protein